MPTIVCRHYGVKKLLHIRESIVNTVVSKDHKNFFWSLAEYNTPVICTVVFSVSIQKFILTIPFAEG